MALNHRGYNPRSGPSVLVVGHSLVLIAVEQIGLGTECSNTLRNSAASNELYGYGQVEYIPQQVLQNTRSVLEEFAENHILLGYGSQFRIRQTRYSKMTNAP